MDPRDTIDSRDNAEAEQMIYDMIRVGDPGKDAEDDVEDEISSYLNPSGDGMEVPSDGPSEDDAENDPERIVGPLIKSAEVHILLSPMVTRCIICIYIYILTSLSSFSPPDRAHLLHRRNEARPKSWAIIKGSPSTQSLKMDNRLSPGNTRTHLSGNAE